FVYKRQKCTTDTCAPANYNCYNDAECKSKVLNNEYAMRIYKNAKYTFTTPTSVFIGSEETFYKTGSLIKMSILSIIYGMVGYAIFKKRKMEHNETSFKNEFLHYFIKSITLIPLTFLAYIIIRESEVIGFVVTCTAIFIYYIVYDLITRKEIYKFLKSIAICLVSFIIILGCYGLFDYFTDRKEIVLDKITKITLEYNDYGTDTYLDITDEKMINELIKDTLSNKYMDSYSGRMAMISSGNKTYIASLYISEELEKKMDEYYLKTVNQNIANFNYKGIDYINILPVTKETKQLIKEAMLEIKEADLSGATLKAYDYKNHKYQVINVPYTKNAKLLKYVQDYQNSQAVEFILKEKEEISFNIEWDVFESEAMDYT
ncbi:MAG: tripartite tricarboxylate transporter TctB family protein, partial [Bacilli bacterium]|nr:tripartite tricarboxylate transporter TctB family protein [Bacilli bacterium]